MVRVVVVVRVQEVQGMGDGRGGEGREEYKDAV